MAMYHAAKVSQKLVFRKAGLKKVETPGPPARKTGGGTSRTKGATASHQPSPVIAGLKTSRLRVGQTNMYSARPSGAHTSRRERKGLGRTPSLPIAHVQRSWSATTWQPQPQKNRPS